MKAALVAYTIVNDEAILSSAGYRTRWLDERAENWERDADELAEFAGRNCYRSFDRPNPATRENKDYLAHILEVGHESVLEHASATFYIEASRSVLTELERHRHLSFSVVSQRYVDPTELGVHVPPAIQECMGEIPGEILRDAVEYAVGSYEAIVSYLSGVRGLPRKQAREAARAVLPNMTNSPMVVTGNHRAWRNVIKQRWHTAADAEIRELAGELLKQLRQVAPNTYQDIPEEPYG
ncbi:ThyX-like thymidylate synthase [Mycobacterium phage Bonamassa]|uniref:ThyX-like thymidylate synthase n=1 Tax=Mycobacterium phage George TaxID=2920883 RepID=G1BQ87_9CAUD|nr:thymidylate synthase [Mycobacterium phage George]AEK32660.1 ThyX-like thymidylate synthase [Mycobacterium phage George]QAX92718.1 ThyX-like thymidylate synthase [Mycobacterium phage HuhtaEnerson15]UJQ86281.1 ThyX-like thymidylate synthase [Mycobacterium phage Bonamassa]